MSKKICGIYAIINIITKKFYIGSSNDVRRRFNTHKSKLRRNIHSNNYLQNAWNKYGEENFIFQLIERTTKEDKVILEEKYIHELETYNSDIGYNLQKYTYDLNGEKNPFYGKKHSDETKMKMRQYRIKNGNSDKHNKAISNGRMGMKFSDEHKESLRQVNLGKKMSDEAKAKMSKVHKGKIISEKQKEQMSLKNRGEGNANSKLTEVKVIIIKIMLEERKYSRQKIADMFNVSLTQIKRILNGSSWNYIQI